MHEHKHQVVFVRTTQRFIWFFLNNYFYYNTFFINLCSGQRSTHVFTTLNYAVAYEHVGEQVVLIHKSVTDNDKCYPFTDK